jgi:hypothetical protein
MKPPASEHVTLVEVLQLTRPFEEFAARSGSSATTRSRRGQRTLVTLQFYADPGPTEAGAHPSPSLTATGSRST